MLSSVQPEFLQQNIKSDENTHTHAHTQGGDEGFVFHTSVPFKTVSMETPLPPPPHYNMCLRCCSD